MTSTRPAGSLLVVATRAYLMMLGPMILLLLMFIIVGDGAGWFTGTSVAFLGLVGALPLARWIEFRGGEPLTSMGEPATPADFRSYALKALVAGLGVWAVTNLLGNHLLSPSGIGSSRQPL